MADFEKLYTVEDVAAMTGMTDRTIRNYLKDGKLKGRKIVGQWRFTEADINALMGIEPEEKEVSAAPSLDGALADFVGGDTCSKYNPDVCALADIECEKAFADDIAGRINAELSDKANGFDGCTLSLDHSDGKARFTIRGSVDFAAAALKIIRKATKKGKE